MEACNPHIDNAEAEEFKITLEDILAFVTGMPEEPALGFVPKPSLQFHNDTTSIYVHQQTVHLSSRNVI